MRHLLITTVIICSAVLFSVVFLDLFFVKLALILVPETRLFDSAPVGFPVMPLLALVGILIGVPFAVTGKPMPKWAKTALTAGVAVAFSLCLVEFALKPVFGRSVPSEYLTYGTYTFAWFHGQMMLGSFPSGHSAQAAAILSVLWHDYPRRRAVWASAFTALAAALIIGQWHYLSDIIAGGYIGTVTGLLAVRALKRVATV